MYSQMDENVSGEALKEPFKPKKHTCSQIIVPLVKGKAHWSQRYACKGCVGSVQNNLLICLSVAVEFVPL